MINEQKLKQEIDKIDWSSIVQYGNVEIQVRAGKPVIVTVKETIKLD